jgi:hypothetical protein
MRPTFNINILYNVGVTWSVLTTNCTVTPLKTPFGLLISLLQSQSHVTRITIISHAVTRLHNYNPHTFVTTDTYYALTLADFSAINYCLLLPHTLDLHTSRVWDLTRRADCDLFFANSLLKTPYQLVVGLLLTQYRVFTHPVSETSLAELTAISSSRIHFARLLTNSLVELLLKHWLLRHFGPSYKPTIIRAALLLVASGC